MLNHVIVPLDGSELAQTALDHALKLLGDGGQITLLTVLQPEEALSLSDFYPSTMIPKTREDEVNTSAAIARAHNYLTRLAEDIAIEHPYTVKARVEVGEPAAVITDIAESLHVDAIVMSTHGRSGLSRWIFGSVTQKVLAAAGCPVFVIPAKMRAEVALPEIAKHALA